MTLYPIKILFISVLVAVVMPPAPAYAHAALMAATPAQSTIVQYQPTQIDLSFSEAITPVPDRIRVIGPDGQRWDAGPAQAEGMELRIPLTGNLLYGTYLVSFRVISADSHPVSGGFSFHYMEQSKILAAGAASAPPDNPAASKAVLAAKYLGYLGLVLLVGAAFMLTMLWPARLDRRGPKRLLWLGFLLVAGSTVAALALQVPYTGLGWRDVLGSTFGIALLIRLAALAAAAILLRPLVNGRGGSAAGLLTLGVAVVGAATWPLSGHPVGSSAPPISVAAVTLHLAGVSVWLGGLCVLSLFVLRRAGEGELRGLLPECRAWPASPCRPCCWAVSSRRASR